MNIIKRYDLSVIVATYTDEAGRPRRKFKTVGTLLETDTGPVVFLDATFNPAAIARPAGQHAVLVSCYPQDSRAPTATTEQQDDDIPF